MISNNKEVLFQPPRLTESSQQYQVKIKIKKEITKIRIVQIEWHMILVESSAIIVKNWIIILTIV